MAPRGAAFFTSDVLERMPVLEFVLENDVKLSLTGSQYTKAVGRSSSRVLQVGLGFMVEGPMSGIGVCRYNGRRVLTWRDMEEALVMINSE